MSENKFKDSDIITILRENGYDAHIIVTTDQSCYKGTEYKVHSVSSWQVAVKRNNRTAYYYQTAFQLSDKTYSTFKKLINSDLTTKDFLKKEIRKNSLIFNDGNLLKVDFITKKFMYLRNFDENNSSTAYFLCTFNRSWENNQYYRNLVEDSDRFILIDNPLDILRIA